MKIPTLLMASLLPVCGHRKNVKILLLILVALAMTDPLIATDTIKLTIYVSPRTDGLTGTGTATDPYNGSTEAQFDGLMARTLPNTTINLSAGTFLSSGSDAFSVKSGWTINGAGIGRTFLKLTSHASTSPKHENLSGNWVTNVTVSNLTCDANYKGYTWPSHQAIGGIFLVGSNNTVSDVEVINCYGDSSQGIEQFAILLCGNHQETGTNLTIENCFTHHFATGSNYTNGSTLSSCTDSQILDCSDDGANHAFAVSDGGSNNKIAGCSSTLNTQDGVYSDTGTISDLTIENNSLFAANIPIMFNSSQSSDNVKILNNKLKSSNSSRSGETAIAMCASGGGTNFQIVGNVFYYLGTQNSGFILNNGKHFTELDVEDNSSNVGLVGGGGSTTDITDVATIMTGNKFNEPMADLSGSNPDAGAPSTEKSEADSTNSTASDNETLATSSTATTAISTTAITPSAPTPRQALASIASTPAGSARTSLIQATFQQWASQSPSSASQYAQSMPAGPDRLAALETVATQWASTNPAAATDWVTSLPPDNDETQHIFHKVAEMWAAQAANSGVSDQPTRL